MRSFSKAVLRAILVRHMSHSAPESWPSAAQSPWASNSASTSSQAASLPSMRPRRSTSQAPRSNMGASALASPSVATKATTSPPMGIYVRSW